MSTMIPGDLTKRTGIQIWILGLLLTTAGCNELSGTNKDTALIPIENGIHFTVKETHDQSHEINAPVEPFIQLYLKTKDIYSCLGYRLVSKLSNSQSNLLVEVKGVAKPNGLCPAALGPAANAFHLEVAPGKYKLIFKYLGTTYPFQLMVTSSSLQVSEGGSFIAPVIETFWRYPEQSFAYLCHSTPDTRWMCENFEQMLKDSLDITPFTFPDYGTKPYPKAGKNYDVASYYRYRKKSVFLEIGKMLESYADSVVSREEGAYLSVLSWKKQGFRSWTDVGE